MTTLKDLQSFGGFVTGSVKKPITFEIDGAEYAAEIHVGRLSAGDYETLFVSEEKGRSLTAEIVSKCITLGPEGKERIKFEEAYKLHPALAKAMINAFNEVNSTKKP